MPHHALPDEVRFYLDHLTTPRIFKPAVCHKEQIRVFSWAPLLGFVYGEHAVLSGHNALLFKPTAFVAVALTIERNVPDFTIRLRAYTKSEALNRFINSSIDDFEPVLEHEEADLIKFEIIEHIIERYIHKHSRRLKADRNVLLGTAMLHHISYFRPGSGLNWSGSSAIAISYAIHEFYFENHNDSDILRLALPIELVYQEGRASGYGFAVLSPGSILSYQLTKRGLEKLTKLADLRKYLTAAIHGNRAVQHRLVEGILNEDLTAFEKGTDHDFIVTPPRSALDVSLAAMIKKRFIVFSIDTGVPKSTGMVLSELAERGIESTWREHVAQVWEQKANVAIDSPEEFIEFINELSRALGHFQKDGNIVSTGLWIDAYDRIAVRLRDIKKRCFKFTGSGQGGSLLAFIDSTNGQTARQILTDLARHDKHTSLSEAESARVYSKCRYFCMGVTNAEPGYTTGRVGGRERTVFLVGAVMGVSLLAFGGVYIPIANDLNDMMQGKAASRAVVNLYWWAWPASIALAVVLLPWLYRLYLLGCRATPPHMRSSVENIMLRKWHIAKAVGHILDLSEKSGKGQVLIWLFLVFWSNLVFVSFLVCMLVIVVVGDQAVQAFGQ